MTNNNVLNEKFISTKLPDICAPRHGLLKSFHHHSDKRIFIVSAPAGFGKTVSTLLWLASSGRKNIWIGLDEYDNSPSIFYKLLCTGILSVSPRNEAMSKILKSPTFTSSPVEHTISFLSEFDGDLESYALVLDDMHLITNEEIKKSLPYVLKRIPMSFQTLFLTRIEHTDYLEAYINEGKVAQITAEELAFSENEIQNYFKTYGRFITPEEAHAVKTSTGGWAMGINVLVKSGHKTFVQNNDEAIFFYIKNQIWEQWDKELQEFMLSTCVSDEMTVELVHRLTGKQNGREILDRLSATNSFVSHMDKDTYRYHRIFLEFLRSLFEADTELNKRKLYQIVSAYYWEMGNHYISLRYALKCEDYEIIAAVLLELYEYSTSGSSVATHVSMQSLYLLSDNMSENLLDQAPYLLISHTWYYFLLGNVERFCSCLDRLYMKLPEIIRHYKPFLEHALFMTMLDYHRPIFDITTALSTEIIDEIAARNTRTTTLTENMPFIHRSHRDYSYFAYDIEGNMLAAAQLFPAILGKDYLYIADSLQAMLYYEKNMLKEAERYASQAISALLPTTVAELSFSVNLTQVAILYAQGQEKLVQTKLMEIQKCIKEQNAEYLLPNFIAYKTKLRLLDGDKSAAEAWLENYFVTPSEQLELYKIVQHFTTARAYLVLTETKEAMSYIIRLKKLGEDFHRPLDIAEASALQSILEWALGKRKEAQDTLEAALSSMQEYGFVRIFADEGASILPILRKVSLRIEREDYTGLLKPLYIHAVTLAAYEQSKRSKGLTTHLNQKPVKLSKQQKHILTLLSQGYKYAQIMELTGLTIHTVKSHASAAYGKLDVNSAMDATIKARELGLIE